MPNRRIFRLAEHHGARGLALRFRNPEAFAFTNGSPRKVDRYLLGVGNKRRPPPVFLGVEALVQIGDVLFFAGTIGSDEGGHNDSPWEN